MKWLKVFGIWLASFFLIAGSVRVIESASAGGRVFFVLVIIFVIVFCIRYWMRRIQYIRAGERSLAFEAAEVLRAHLSERAVRDELVEHNDRADLGGGEKASVRSKTKLPRLELIYTNTRDLTQRRLVSPYRSGANMDYFDAWCFMEDVRRSFSFDPSDGSDHLGQRLPVAQPEDVRRHQGLLDGYVLLA